jgi:hypothetical protein
MFVYWALFTAPLLSALTRVRVDRYSRRIAIVFAFLALTVIIGLRFEVGCDWPNYIQRLYNLGMMPLGEAVGQTDPAYGLLNWVVYRLGGEIYPINVVCAALYAWGLLAFCQRQPRPWLTFAFAIPYMTIVVAMGYTRQATAIGLLMLAFNAFTDRKLIRFFVFVALATCFHRSAVAMAPLGIFLQQRRSFSPLLIGVAATAFLALFITADAADAYVYGYIEKEQEGTGGVYRLPLNALAGLLFLRFRKPWERLYGDSRLYLMLTVMSLAVVPLFFLWPVAADRMGLYLLPFQVAVMARLPDIFKGTRYVQPVMLAVVGLYASMLFFWLLYSNHVWCWVPYRMSLFN